MHFSETYISQTTGPMSFKLGMLSCIYVGHKICEFDRNRPVVIEIRGVENGELAVAVNNTLVCHTAFLAADTRPCVLMYELTYMCKKKEWESKSHSICKQVIKIKSMVTS